MDAVEDRPGVEALGFEGVKTVEDESEGFGTREKIFGSVLGLSALGITVVVGAAICTVILQVLPWVIVFSAM